MDAGTRSHQAQPRSSAPRSTAAALGLLYLLVGAPAPLRAQTEEYYQAAVKALGDVRQMAAELSDPPPLGPVPVEVGTFDAATGGFKWHCGLTTRFKFLGKPDLVSGPNCGPPLDPHDIPPPPGKGKGGAVQLPGGGSDPGPGEPPLPTIDHIATIRTADASAILVELVIRVENNTQFVKVIVEGEETVLLPSQTAFRKIAPFAGPVAFSLLSASGKAFGTPTHVNNTGTGHDLDESFSIESPLTRGHHRLGAGGFVIPALPVAIVYQTPWGEAQTFSHSRTQSVSLKSLFSETASGKLDMEFHPFRGIINFLKLSSGAATAAGQIPGNEAAAGDAGTLDGIVGTLEKLVGDYQDTQEHTEQVFTTMDGSTLNVALTLELDVSSNPDLGPGPGDKLVYLRDVVWGWGGLDGKFVMGPVAYRKMVVTTVQGLKDEPFGSPPSPIRLDSLLVLDPQADPASPVVLDADRFVSCQEIDNEDSQPVTVTARYEFSESHLQAQTRSFTEFTQEDAGPLAKFLGTDATIIQKTSTTVTTSRELQESQVLESKFTIPGKTHARFCYDVLFGSFFVQEVHSASAPAAVSGTWVDGSGKPVEGARITLQAGETTITTFTGKEGAFAFRSPSIRPGDLILRYAGAESIVRLSGEPVSGLVVVAEPRERDFVRRGLFVRGDSNRDGMVDLSDALHTFSFLFLGGPTPLCAAAADSNDDEVVDISDAVATLGFLFLGRPTLPPPGPLPGPDPTAGLACDA